MTRLKKLVAVAQTLLTLQMDSASFEAEFLALQKRAKAALRKPKQPSPNPRFIEAQKKGAAANRARAVKFARELKPILRELRSDGYESYRELAAALNNKQVKPARGKMWTPASVRLVMLRRV